MNCYILIYIIAKLVSDWQIGITQLTLKCKFDILATMEILMRVLNLQISNTPSITFLTKLDTFPSCTQIFPFCIMWYFVCCLNFILKRKALARRQGVLYMAEFSSIQRRAEGGQARPQMGSV